MMKNNTTAAFDEKDYEISEQKSSVLILAKKKIVFPKMNREDVKNVNNTNGIIIAGSMEMIDSFLEEQNQLIMN